MSHTQPASLLERQERSRELPRCLSDLERDDRRVLVVVPLRHGPLVPVHRDKSRHVLGLC